MDAGGWAVAGKRPTTKHDNCIFNSSIALARNSELVDIVRSVSVGNLCCTVSESDVYGPGTDVIRVSRLGCDTYHSA